MIVITWSLAALLVLQAPAATPTCELTDNRCKALLYIKRAKEAPTVQQRALYLHAAHRSYLFLYDRTGDQRDLCAARRMFDRSLAVKGLPADQRASFEAARKDLESRERNAGGRCASAAKGPSKKEPPLVAAVSAPGVAETPQEVDSDGASVIASDTAPVEPLAKRERAAEAEPHAEVVLPLDPANREPDAGALLPVMGRSPPPMRRTPPLEERRPGRGLAIAGGVGLSVGLGLTGVAGYMGGRLGETVREARALDAMVEGYATADQLAKDAALQQDYRRWGPPTLVLALVGGTTLVVSAVLLGVGSRRMLKAASQTALMPVPGGLAFHARF